ncbi:MAG: hypothetical protein Q6364_01225, partial [Candidatus Hermodarchaeota archaeon]|nr:hypothetical protein [Candidatus Hermodarchaeota archaeon]
IIFLTLLSTLAKKIILRPVLFNLRVGLLSWGGKVAITKVASFIQGPPEAMKNGFSSTPEADLVSALMYLRTQVQEPIPYVYLSRVYVPFFLVHALPGRSLIISGVGEPTISVRHSSIPSLVQMREKLRSIEKMELVPKLLGEFIQTFEKPTSELIVIRNAMLPTMIETLRLLVDSAIAPPREDVCLSSRLSTKEIHDVGILFRNERARLDDELAQLGQAEILIDEFVDEQIRLLDARQDRMSPGATLRWEAPHIESEPDPSFFAEEPSLELDQTKERISGELVGLISQLEKSLGVSSEQCRRLVSQIQTKPIEAEWHLANVKTRLLELQNTTSAFQEIIQQAIKNLEQKSEQLHEAKLQSQWGQEEPLLQPAAPSPSPFPSGTITYTRQPREEEATDAQLAELSMVREATVKLHTELKGATKKLRDQLEGEQQQFETISAPADTLQGYLPLMRLVIPIFAVKIGQGEGRYGVIPPLRLNEGSQTQYSVKFYDDVFGEQLIQLLRTEIRASPLFRQTLDDKARGADWITRPFSTEHVQRGTRQLANYGLLTYETREQVADYWTSLLSL